MIVVNKQNVHQKNDKIIEKTTLRRIMSKAQKLLTAFTLHDAGMEMKHLQIARRNKNASKEELEQLFQDWLKKQKQETTQFFRSLAEQSIFKMMLFKSLNKKLNIFQFVISI